MCGIVGVVTSKNSNSLEQDIRQMTNRLTHRGPDNEGYYIDQERGVGLGHRRLSILDLSSSGNQPMATDCDRYLIIYNGEVYNHRDIRVRLDYSNWAGSSDTETILNAVREWGIPKTLKELNGMFSIALLDKDKQKLFLARDRIGIKPLYFGKQLDSFVFASELKPIITSSFWDAKVDRTVLKKYFRYGFIPSPDCILKDVHKLKPGHYLSYDLMNNEICGIKEYWNFDQIAQKGLKEAAENDSLEDNLEMLDELLNDAVKKRMLSDVPLGAFLSGGIDSSIITAIMQKHSSRPVNTYSIGFEDEEYDESVYSEVIAKYLGTNHKTKVLDKNNSLDIIPQLPQMYDEPFGDSSQIPTHLVSRLAASDVKVILSGDGADELFAGYNRHFMATKVWAHIRHIPALIRLGASRIVSFAGADTLGKVINRLYPKSKKIPHLTTKLEKLNRMIQTGSFEELYEELVITSPEYSDLIKDKNGIGIEKEEIKGLNFSDPQVYFVYQDTIRALPDDMLVKVDRASMACSLEVRVPFLDHRLVEYSWQIPFNQKIKNGEGKWILKQLAYQYIPKRLLDRPKKGFEVPIAEWLRNELKSWAEELLFNSTPIEEEIWNDKVIANIWNEHQREDKNHKDVIWAILMYRAWENKYKEYLV